MLQEVHEVLLLCSMQGSQHRALLLLWGRNFYAAEARLQHDLGPGINRSLIASVSCPAACSSSRNCGDCSCAICSSNILRLLKGWSGSYSSLSELG